MPFGAGFVSAEDLQLKPAGGVQVKNARGEVVMWFKAKDPEGSRSFGLALFRPELADGEEMRKSLESAFRELLGWARLVGFPVYDMREFEGEVRRTFSELGADVQEYVRSRRVEDLTFRLTDLVSGRKVDVVFGLRPVRPRRKRKGEQP